MREVRLVAVDVAVLLPSNVAIQVAQLNARLQPPPDGFVFDKDHFPHLTLIQLFARYDQMKTLRESIADVLRSTPPLALRTTTVSCARTTSTLGIEPSTALVELHQRLINQLEPFTCTGGGIDTFYTNGELPRQSDVDWVRCFRTQSANAQYKPHITLGVGDLTTSISPLTFTAAEVAICHLGRFCTCRAVFTKWALTDRPA